MALPEPRVAQDMDDREIGHEVLHLVQGGVGEFDRREDVLLFFMVSSSTNLCEEECKLTPHFHTVSLFCDLLGLS